jgi:GGDEF domain-containing protein
MIGKIKRHEVRKDYLALITDNITGAFTPQYLAACFSEEIRKKEKGVKISCMRINIRFKEEVVGDGYNKILKEVYHFLSSNIRKNDLIVNLKNKSFLVVIKSSNIFAAEIIKTRFRLKAKVQPFDCKLEVGPTYSREDALKEIELNH